MATEPERTPKLPVHRVLNEPMYQGSSGETDHDGQQPREPRVWPVLLVHDDGWSLQTQHVEQVGGIRRVGKEENARGRIDKVLFKRGESPKRHWSRHAPLTVFIETQAVGTPVASFDRRGIGEVVLDKVTGLLAPDYLSAFTNAA